MPRVPRCQLDDGYFHVTVRAIRRFPMFIVERDATSLLDTLDYVTRDLAELAVLAYCFMPNHVHYVVHAEVAQLSRAMRHINGAHAQRFNREHGYRGHLQQGRFHSKPIVDEEHLNGAIRYVVLNPVRAGLCRHPEQWQWSSYRATAGLEWPRSFLAVERTLSLFGPTPERARQSLVACVEEALPLAVAEGLSRGQSPPVPPAAFAYPNP